MATGTVMIVVVVVVIIIIIISIISIINVICVKEVFMRVNYVLKQSRDHADSEYVSYVG